MKPGGGKGKGAGFERFVCKTLSKWVSGGERDDLFWRSAMSGGRATLQLRQNVVNKTQGGDISSISVEGAVLIDKALIECKFYADLQIGTSLITGVGRLRKFWISTQKAALSFGKTPVLIAKQNRFPPLLVCQPRMLALNDSPILLVPDWNADIYLFEEATKVKARIKRLSS